ncbi:MAG: hypothetical protein QNL26_12595 [Acidimicrobiia bacterium]|nr:hypothetical protein [Acidimicrobiia bacterium]
MNDHDNKSQTSTRSSIHGPSDEVLRETVRHDDGDLTIQSHAGEIRLVNGSGGWMRYTRYLEERSIDPHVEEA